ncbi:MAG: Asp/Glu racemase [Rhodovibrionaceae bacterium]
MAEAAKKTSEGPAIRKIGMPYELDEGLGARARIGLIVLATDQTVEHEFRQIITPLEGVAFYESRIKNAQQITEETLAEMEKGITPCTEVIMPGCHLDVVAYGCTSGAMVIGDQRVGECTRAARPGIAYTTPMKSAYAAFEALGAKSIAYIAPYSESLCVRMCEEIEEHGFAVPEMGSWNEPDDDKAARISAETVAAAVLDLGSSDLVDAVFVSCSSVRIALTVEAIEAELGKPVTSSNHAMAWHCLRLAGYDDPIPGYGRLFRTGLAAS